MALQSKSIYIIQRNTENSAWNETYISGSDLILSTNQSGDLYGLPINSLSNSGVVVSEIQANETSASMEAFNEDAIGEYISINATNKILVNKVFSSTIQTLSGSICTLYYSTTIQDNPIRISFAIYSTNAQNYSTQSITLQSSPINSVLSSSFTILPTTYNGCGPKSYYTLEINKLTPSNISDIKFRFLKIEI